MLLDFVGGDGCGYGGGFVCGVVDGCVVGVGDFVFVVVCGYGGVGCGCW